MVLAASVVSSGSFALCAAISWLARRLVQGEMNWRLVRPTYCRILNEVFLIGKKKKENA